MWGGNEEGISWGQKERKKEMQIHVLYGREEGGLKRIQRQGIKKEKLTKDGRDVA